MKLAEKILNFFEKEYKGIEYDIVKKGNAFHSEIEREEVEGTKSKAATTTDNRTKEYIDQVI